jgi:hypothetical protein
LTGGLWRVALFSAPSLADAHDMCHAPGAHDGDALAASFRRCDFHRAVAWNMLLSKALVLAEVAPNISCCPGIIPDGELILCRWPR